MCNSSSQACSVSDPYRNSNTPNKYHLIPTHPPTHNRSYNIQKLNQLAVCKDPSTAPRLVFRPVDQNSLLNKNLNFNTVPDNPASLESVTCHVVNTPYLSEILCYLCYLNYVYLQTCKIAVSVLLNSVLQRKIVCTQISYLNNDHCQLVLMVAPIENILLDFFKGAGKGFSFTNSELEILKNSSSIESLNLCRNIDRKEVGSGFRTQSIDLPERQSVSNSDKVSIKCAKHGNVSDHNCNDIGASPDRITPPVTLHSSEQAHINTSNSMDATGTSSPSVPSATAAALSDETLCDRETGTPDPCLPTSSAPSPATSEKSGRSSRSSAAAAAATSTPSTRSSTRVKDGFEPAATSKQKSLAKILAEGAVLDGKSGGSGSNSTSRSNTPERGSSGKRKRDSSAGSTASSTSSTTTSSGNSTKKKKAVKPETTEVVEQSAASVSHPLNDNYCWECHREGEFICCEMCPRVYHLRCANLDSAPPQDWACHHCHTIMLAENVENRSRAMQLISVDQLGTMLKFALTRVKKTPTMEPFTRPVDVAQFPTYKEIVLHPVDFCTLETNIDNKLYGSTEAFMADLTWIVHNSVIFNGANSKVTSLARTALKIIKQEMSEIETCPDCYMNAHTLPDTWFTEACRLAHPLVWARLKGFPYWPAKAVKWHNNSVDVRFFGRHDKSWVAPKDCYLLSDKMPVPLKNKNKTLESCMNEVRTHIDRLKERFGNFVYAKHRVPFNPSDPQQVTVMLPLYRGPPLVAIHSSGADSAYQPDQMSDDETSSITSTDSGGSAAVRRTKSNKTLSLKAEQQADKLGKREDKATVTKSGDGTNTRPGTPAEESGQLDEDMVEETEEKKDEAGSDPELKTESKEEKPVEETEDKSTLELEDDLQNEATLNTEEVDEETERRLLEENIEEAEEKERLRELEEKEEGFIEEELEDMREEEALLEIRLNIDEEEEMLNENKAQAPVRKTRSRGPHTASTSQKTSADADDDEAKGPSEQVPDIRDEEAVAVEHPDSEGVININYLEESLLAFDREQEEKAKTVPEDELEEQAPSASSSRASVIAQSPVAVAPVADVPSVTGKTTPLFTDAIEFSFDSLNEPEPGKQSPPPPPAAGAGASTNSLTEERENSAGVGSGSSQQGVSSEVFGDEDPPTFPVLSAITPDDDEDDDPIKKLTELSCGGLTITLPSVSTLKTKEAAGVMEEAEDLPAAGGGGSSGGESSGGDNSQRNGYPNDGGNASSNGDSGRSNGEGGGGGDDNGEDKGGGRRRGKTMEDEEEEEEQKEEEEDEENENGEEKELKDDLDSFNNALTIKKVDEASLLLEQPDSPSADTPAMASITSNNFGSSVSISSVMAPSLGSSISISAAQADDPTTEDMEQGSNPASPIPPDAAASPAPETEREDKNSLAAASLGLNSSITFTRSSAAATADDEEEEEEEDEGSDRGSPSPHPNDDDKEEESTAAVSAPSVSVQGLNISSGCSITSAASLGLLSSSITFSRNNNNNNSTNKLPSSVSVSSVAGVKRKSSEMENHESSEEEDEEERSKAKQIKVEKEDEPRKQNDATDEGDDQDAESDSQKQLDLQTAAIESQLGSSVSFTLRNSSSLTVSDAKTNRQSSKSSDSGAGKAESRAAEQKSLMESVMKRVDVKRVNSGEKGGSQSSRRSSDAGSAPGDEDDLSDNLTRLRNQISISSVSSKASASKEHDEESRSPDSALSLSLSSLGSSISISKGTSVTARSSSASVSVTSVSSSVSVIKNLESERGGGSSLKSNGPSEDFEDSSASRLLETSMKASKEIPSLMQLSKDVDVKQVDVKPVLNEKGIIVSNPSSSHATSNTTNKEKHHSTTSSSSKDRSQSHNSETNHKDSSSNNNSSSNSASNNTNSHSNSSSKENNSSSNLPAGVDTSKLNSSISIIAVSSSARVTSTTAPSRPGSGTSARSSSTSPLTSASPAVGGITIKGQSLLQDHGASVPPPPPLSQGVQQTSQSSPSMSRSGGAGGGGFPGMRGNIRGISPSLLMAAAAGNHRMNCPPLRPQQSNSGGHGSNLLPPEAGPLSQQLHQHSHKLADLMRASLEEVLASLVVSGTPEARVAALQLELERSSWRHQQELAEVRHNADIMLGEMRASLEAEKHRAVEEVRRSMEAQQVDMRRQMERRLTEKVNEVKRQCDGEKQRAVEETKKKQWCANCGKEALFFCCWNTSYCDYPCQQAHWPQHMSVCGQNSDTNGGGGGNANGPSAAGGGGGMGADGLGGTGSTDNINGDLSGHGSRGTTPIHSLMNQNPSPGTIFPTGGPGGGNDMSPAPPCSGAQMPVPSLPQQHHLMGSMGPMAIRANMANNMNNMGYSRSQSPSYSSSRQSRPPSGGGLGGGMGGVMGGPAMAAMAAMAGGGGNTGQPAMKMPSRYLPPGMLQQQMYSSLEHRSLLMMMGGAGGAGRAGGHAPPAPPPAHHPSNAPMMRPPMHFRPRFM